MREIGSEFWDVPTTNTRSTLVPASAQWFLSGRSALQSIIKDLGVARSVSIPSWCCDSMVKPFVDVGYTIHFHPVVFENGTLRQKLSLDSDVLFLMDYFGYTASVTDLRGYKGIVIRDVTHSIFSAIYSDADYYFGSLRKWCGVWTGGYAWTNDGHHLPMANADDLGYIPLREKAMQQKNSYIHGWGVTDKEYLKLYEAAEDCLESVGIASAASRDLEQIKLLDVEMIKRRRRANAEVLRRAFPDWLIFPGLSSTDIPMFVPVLVPDGKRDALRHYLINNDIYCPIHWPVSEYHRLSEEEQFLYNNGLSLVCDQRYTEEDMNRVVQMIELFMEG